MTEKTLNMLEAVVPVGLVCGALSIGGFFSSGETAFVCWFWAAIVGLVLAGMLVAYIPRKSRCPYIRDYESPWEHDCDARCCAEQRESDERLVALFGAEWWTKPHNALTRLSEKPPSF